MLVSAGGAPIRWFVVRVGEDVDTAFLPERVAPGRPDDTIRSAPKSVGGGTPACALILDVLEATAQLAGTVRSTCRRLDSSAYRRRVGQGLNAVVGGTRPIASSVPSHHPEHRRVAVGGCRARIAVRRLRVRDGVVVWRDHRSRGVDGSPKRNGADRDAKPRVQSARDSRQGRPERDLDQRGQRAAQRDVCQWAKIQIVSSEAAAGLKVLAHPQPGGNDPLLLLDPPLDDRDDHRDTVIGHVAVTEPRRGSLPVVGSIPSR